MPKGDDQRMGPDRKDFRRSRRILAAGSTTNNTSGIDSRKANDTEFIAIRQRREPIAQRPLAKKEDKVPIWCSNKLTITGHSSVLACLAEIAGETTDKRRKMPSEDALIEGNDAHSMIGETARLPNVSVARDVPS